MMEFLYLDWLGKPLWMWLAFLGIVAALLALDLGVLHRKQREIGVRESLLLSAFYIALGLAFGGWIWWQVGETAAVQYVTGFVIEKSLAMDNVFVIAMIFGYFAVPRVYQHRVLFWGILGVIVLRAVMIGLGATLVQQFSWVLYIFAAFLVFTGIKMWLLADKEYDPGSNIGAELPAQADAADRWPARRDRFFVRGRSIRSTGKTGALRDAAVSRTC